MRKTVLRIICCLMTIVICIGMTACSRDPYIATEKQLEKAYKKTKTKQLDLAVWAPPYSEIYAPDGKFEIEEVYKMLADAGINLVYNEQEWNPELLNKIMDACQKYDMKSIIGLPISDLEWAMSVVEPTVNHPACWGYNLMDEPPSESFVYLSELAQEIRAIAPEEIKLTTNLLPNYTFSWAGFDEIELDAYSTYVRGFINGVNIDTFSFDFYPLGSNSESDDKSILYYMKNLLEVHTRSAASDVPLGSIVQTGSWGGAREPNRL